MAAGSWGGTSSPAPLVSSSRACGKSVETTGSTEVTASTRTPEVTWSRES